MRKGDFETRDYADQLDGVQSFAEKETVVAIQITEEGLEAGKYAKKDVRFDKWSNQYVIYIYLMRRKYLSGASGCMRVCELEDIHPVKAGDWIITAPKMFKNDRETNYPMPDDEFRNTFEPTDEPDVYRTKNVK